MNMSGEKLIVRRKNNLAKGIFVYEIAGT